jgi:asparagine synthase (glutamine-hydrolysing)
LPGKALHVASLAGIANRLEGYGRERTQPIVAPLLAQPVVEYCLRIPTWLWCRDGMNRAMARQAYADMLPSSIARRTTKGTPSALAFRLVEDNRALLRERLACGVLADWSIINVPDLLAALDRHHHLTMDECARISLLNDAESWARGWEAKRSEIDHYIAGPADEGSGNAASPLRPATQL